MRASLRPLVLSLSLLSSSAVAAQDDRERLEGASGSLVGAVSQDVQELTNDQRIHMFQVMLGARNNPSILVQADWALHQTMPYSDRTITELSEYCSMAGLTIDSSEFHACAELLERYELDMSALQVIHERQESNLRLRKGATDVAAGLRSEASLGLWDTSLLERLSFQEDIIESSKSFATSDPEFKRGSDWVKAHLMNRLSLRPHAIRSSTTYSENADQIAGIQSEHIPFILKQYLDFFESSEGQACLRELYNGGAETEEGGMLLPAHGGISFSRVKNALKQDTDVFGRAEAAQSSFQAVIIAELIPMLGFVHTHPSTDKSVTGPSGFSKIESLNFAWTADTGSIWGHAYRVNPLCVDIVVSHLTTAEDVQNDRFSVNVDAFFAKDGDPTKREVTVIDLGTYTLPNSSKTK